MSTDDTAREVLARVHAAHGLCGAILSERLQPTPRNLAAVARLLDNASLWAAGEPPEGDV